MSSDFDNMNTWNINFYYITFKKFSLSIHVASGDKHSYTQNYWTAICCKPSVEIQIGI